MKLVFATHNINKIDEIKTLLPKKMELVSLKDLGCFREIPETGDTLEANALIKASFVKKHYGLDCFADDSGLEVAALGGAPGVYSARYAGVQKSAEKNIDKNYYNLNNPLSKSRKKEIFRPFRFGNIDNYMLITELKDTGSESDKQTIDLYAVPNIGTTRVHSRHNNLPTVVYTFTKDKKAFDDHLKEMIVNVTHHLSLVDSNQLIVGSREKYRMFLHNLQ